MEHDQSPQSAGRVKRLVWIFVAVAGLAVLYQAVMWGVRQYTDQLIEEVEGTELPPFSLTDLQGQAYTDQSLRGKTVVLNFFRSKCHGCQAESAGLKEFVAQVHPDRALVLGVMVDRVQGFPPEVTAATLAGFGYRHPILMADEAFVAAFHGVGWAQITPITYVVDPKGRIVKSFRHPYGFGELLAALP